MKTKLKEYFKNMSNTKKIAISVLAMVFLCLVFTGSYALFTTKVSNKTYVVKVGTLDIDFEDANSNLIVLNNTYPMTNNEGLATTGYTFNVSNNGTVPGKYLVRLEIADDNEIPIEYIKVAYQKTKEESINVSTPALSTPKLLSNLNDSLVVFKDESIGVGKKDTINLKLWLDINTPNDMQNKQFKARIIIDSTQDYEDASYAINTKPIIELNKDENGNIDYIIPVNGTYTELGVASVKDDKDKLLPSDVTITGTVDTTTAGTYTRKYTVTDSDNNTSTVTRTIYVGDDESLQVIHGLNNVINSFSASEKQAKEVIACDHIYGYDDMYLNCKLYNTIESSIVAKKKGAIILLANATIESNLNLVSYSDYIFELNGKTIDSQYVNEAGTDSGNNSHGVLMVRGNLIINDRIGTGGMHTGGVGHTIYANTGSNIEINGGDYKGRSAIYMNSNSNVIINGGSFDNVYKSTIWVAVGTSNLTINDGTFISNNSNYVVMSAAAGIININGGVFSASSNSTIYTYGSGDIINITAGTIRSDVGNAIRIGSQSTVNITQEDDNKIYISAGGAGTDGTGGIYCLGNLNIVATDEANQSNTCTDDILTSTSSLCVYGGNSSIRAVKDNARILINGGSYADDADSKNCLVDQSGELKIKNANIIHNQTTTSGGAISNSDYYTTVEEGGLAPGTITVCSSKITSGTSRDIYNLVNQQYTIISDDNTFVGRTNNTPSVYGTYTSVSTCPF